MKLVHSKPIQLRGQTEKNNRFHPRQYRLLRCESSWWRKDRNLELENGSILNDLEWACFDKPHLKFGFHGSSYLAYPAGWGCLWQVNEFLIFQISQNFQIFKDFRIEPKERLYKDFKWFRMGSQTRPSLLNVSGFCRVNYLWTGIA